MQAQAAEYSGYAGPFRCFLHPVFISEEHAGDEELVVREQEGEDGDRGDTRTRPFAAKQGQAFCLRTH